MNDRFLAEHRTSHGSRQGKVFTRSKAGDHPRIGSPFRPRTASDDARIARCLLIPAHRSPAPPGERIEPVQGQQRLRRQVGNEIVAAMVRKLMRNRHVAGLYVVIGHEGRRQGHHLVGNAESHGAGNSGRFHQPHLARIPYRNTVFQQLTAHLHVIANTPADEYQRATYPKRQQQVRYSKAHHRSDDGFRSA